MIITKKHDSDKNLFSRLWNEFLFAREFEYETPLTPEEMAAALKALEKSEPKSWMLSFGKLRHELQFEQHSDKAIDFKMDVKDADKSWWSSGYKFHLTEGSLIANPETGMTIVKGRTRFSSEYYVTMMLLFIANLFTQTQGINLMDWGFWLWGSMIFITWFALYHERNAISDRLDDIIMHAKSERSIAILEGESLEDASTAETLIESQELMESELRQQPLQK